MGGGISLREIIVALLKSIRKFFITGSTGPMWYVLALIYGLILLYPLLKRADRKSSILAWGISIFFYFIAVLGDSYYYLFNAVPFIQNGFDILTKILGNLYLFRGPIYIMIGRYIAQDNVKIREMKTRSLLIIWIVVAAIQYSELLLVENLEIGLRYSTTFMKPVTTLFVCLFVLSINWNPKFDTLVLAQCSTVVYFLHICVRDILMNFIGDMYIVFVLTLVICLAVAVVIINLQKIRKLSWLKRVC